MIGMGGRRGVKPPGRARRVMGAVLLFKISLQQPHTCICRCVPTEGEAQRRGGAAQSCPPRGPQNGIKEKRKRNKSKRQRQNLRASLCKTTLTLTIPVPGLSRLQMIWHPPHLADVKPRGIISGRALSRRSGLV